MNKDLYLLNDLNHALSEHRAIWTCLNRVKESFVNGDLKEARLTTNDLLNSLNELERLKEKKKRHEQLKEVVERLVSKGILVEMVSSSRKVNL